MQQKERTLNKSNVDIILKEFVKSIGGLGISNSGKTGISLFEALKREKLTTGPYPGVTLFEAANRIMTDLVIFNQRQHWSAGKSPRRAGVPYHVGPQEKFSASVR